MTEQQSRNRGIAGEVGAAGAGYTRQQRGRHGDGFEDARKTVGNTFKGTDAARVKEWKWKVDGQIEGKTLFTPRSEAASNRVTEDVGRNTRRASRE
jgi:hypothetical protein